MSHRYIVSSTPYLKQSSRPIYKVPPRGNVSNPNHMRNGAVKIVFEWPFGNLNIDDIIPNTPPKVSEPLIQEPPKEYRIAREDIREGWFIDNEI